MTFKPPHPGELKHLASVQEFVTSGVDANGQPTGTWEEIAQAYVRRDAISGRIAEFARQLYASATHNIYCRYNQRITRNTRFVIGGVIYSIGWIDTDGVEWMRCTTEENWPQAQPT